MESWSHFEKISGSASNETGGETSSLVVDTNGRDLNLEQKQTTDLCLNSDSLPTLSTAKKPRLNSQMTFCEVHGCKKYLSSSKEYYKRHKVCELHSKTAKVIVGGYEQRFCQQCSRFHVLSEFDNGKRSCRKRLEGHNARRRKSCIVLNNSTRLQGAFQHYNGSRSLHSSSASSTILHQQKDEEAYGWSKPATARAEHGADSPLLRGHVACSDTGSSSGQGSRCSTFMESSSYQGWMPNPANALYLLSSLSQDSESLHSVIRRG